MLFRSGTGSRWSYSSPQPCGVNVILKHDMCFFSQKQLTCHIYNTLFLCKKNNGLMRDLKRTNCAMMRNRDFSYFKIMISNRKQFCRSYETGLVVAKLPIMVVNLAIGFVTQTGGRQSFRGQRHRRSQDLRTFHPDTSHAGPDDCGIVPYHLRSGPAHASCSITREMQKKRRR